MNKEKLKGKRLGLLTGLIVLMLVGYFNIPHPVLEHDEHGFAQIRWAGTIIASANESSYSGTASGILEVYIVNHSATPKTAYDTNLSADLRTWANASLDADGTGTTYYAYAHVSGNASLSTTLTVKWGTTFDVVVRWRGCRTHCYDGSKFIMGDCRVKINATGGGVTMSEVTGYNVNSSNATDHTFLWGNTYFDNSGSGYSLSKGGTCTITNIKLEFEF